MVDVVAHTSWGIISCINVSQTQGNARVQHSCLPKMPPKRKMSKVSPSSGLKSLDAAGSSRHTRSFLSAYISSMPLVSIFNPWACLRFSGSFKVVGTEESKNFAPDAYDSDAMVEYSSDDHASSSSSRCSTTKVLPWEAMACSWGSGTVFVL
jgi:hypothetical protein